MSDVGDMNMLISSVSSDGAGSACSPPPCASVQSVDHFKKMQKTYARAGAGREGSASRWR